MADYSWVRIEFASTDPEIVAEVETAFGGAENIDTQGDTTVIEGERAYGMADEVESLLMEKGIAYSRWSDGKYEYDGDEAHWLPGMTTPRIFTRLDNGGRVFTQQDIPEGITDEALGALVREHFSFS